MQLYAPAFNKWFSVISPLDPVSIYKTLLYCKVSVTLKQLMKTLIFQEQQHISYCILSRQEHEMRVTIITIMPISLTKTLRPGCRVTCTEHFEELAAVLGFEPRAFQAKSRIYSPRPHLHFIPLCSGWEPTPSERLPESVRCIGIHLASLSLEPLVFSGSKTISIQCPEVGKSQTVST